MIVTHMQSGETYLFVNLHLQYGNADDIIERSHWEATLFRDTGNEMGGDQMSVKVESHCGSNSLDCICQ